MREDAKTPDECSLAWAKEFLEGAMTPEEHRKKVMTACRACPCYDECYPPYEKMDAQTKAMYDSFAGLVFRESMGK